MKKGGLLGDKENLYTSIYIWMTVIGCISFIVIMYIFCGETFNKFFFGDRIDTGMDFFNSVLYTKGRHPYTQYHVIYPPLANVFFWIIGHSVPRDLFMNWPDSFENGIMIRGTSADLRLQQVLFFYFTIFVVMVAIMFVVVVSYAYENARTGMAMGAAMLFSMGSLYAFERGNVINLTMAFLLMYLIFYRSEKKWLRELALISLGIAAGFKLYPALFGVLLVLDKRWKDAIRTVIYGILFFVVPFTIFDGVDGFLAFYKALTSFTSKGTSLATGSYTIQCMIRSILLQFSFIFKYDFEIVALSAAGIISAVKWIVIGILGVNVLVNKTDWGRYLSIGLIVLFVQDSGNYTLMFLLPALLGICQVKEPNLKTTIYFVRLSLLHLLIPIMGKSELLSMNYNVILKQYLLLFITIAVISDTIKEVVTMAQKKIGKK